MDGPLISENFVRQSFWDALAVVANRYSQVMISLCYLDPCFACP